MVKCLFFGDCGNRTNVKNLVLSSEFFDLLACFFEGGLFRTPIIASAR